MAGTQKVQQRERTTDNGNGRVVHELKKGSVRATVWENQARNGAYHRVTFSRLYKKGEQWKSTQSFSVLDLREVAEVAVLAKDWLERHLDGKDAGEKGQQGRGGKGDD